MNATCFSRITRQLCALLVALVALTTADPVSAQGILSFDFAGLTGSEATANSNFNNAGLTGSTISRGVGLTASRNGDRFNATNWALTSIENAVTGNKYMEFTIAPNAGQKFTVTTIVVQWQRSGAGNVAIALRSSADAYAANIDGVKSVADNEITQTFTWTVNQAESTGPVTYRFYSYAESDVGSGGPGDGFGNDITVNGSVQASSESAPSITSPLVALGTAFESFSYQIEASNSPTSFDASDLPPGLSVNTETGLISGTPTVQGLYTVDISATNADGTGSARLTLSLAPNPGAPQITSASTSTTAIDAPFSYQIEATGSPTGYAASLLPLGLTVDPLTGLISGTPTFSGIFAVTISATNAFGTGSQTLLLTVTGPPVIIGNLTGNAIYLGSAFSYQILASGTPAPTSFGATGLPDGLTVDPASGLISGTPTTAGVSVIEVSATNTSGTGTASFTFTVFDQTMQNAIPRSVVVNKYVNATVDKVQLLVVGNGVPGSTVDMRGMIIKDFANNMADDTGGKYLFSNNDLWSAVPAGTLIALSAGTGQAEDADVSDFFVAVNLGNSAYFTGGGGSFNISSAEMIMIKSAGTGVSGVAGGIHALAGGTPGAQFNAFQGAKLLAREGSESGFGVIAENTTSALADYGTSGGAAAADARGAVPNANLDFASWNNSSNGNFVSVLRGIIDGTGSAIVRNASAGSPFLGRNLFGRDLPSQTVEIVYTPTSPVAPVGGLTVEVPSSFGAPLPANVSVSGPGAEEAVVAVAGQLITISNLESVNPDTVTVAISGLATPDTSAPLTNNGSYVFAVRSRGVGGGGFAPLAVPPSALVLIPIANVRNANPSTFVPVLLGQTVAVEGVCSVGRLGSGSTSSALQDATHGVALFSQSAVVGPQNRGHRYAVVGAVTQASGLVRISLDDPNLVFDLGFEADPAPVTVSVVDFITNGLAYQSRVIRIENLTYVSGTWSTGQSVILRNASGNEVTVRIQPASTAGRPSFPVTLTGLGGQFDSSSPFNTGFQIQPRDQADAPANPPVINSPLEAGAVQGTLFSYRITATDNPPPTSFDAGQLPPGLSIDGITGFISGTPTEIGSFDISISATNGGGTGTATLRLTVTSVYNNWASSFNLDPAVATGPNAGAPTADPDGDNFTNAQEYAFGTNPTVGSPSLLTTESSGGNLTVTWLERSDVTYSVQSTVDLATLAFAADPAVTVVNGPTEPAPPAGYLRKQFTIATPGKKFLRVTASLSP